MDATTLSSPPKQRVLDSRYHEKALQEILKRNKKCADCLKPSPSFVNLSIGTFVCLECSGLLREFEFRTKGLGLSTFTPQEVQMLDLNGGNKRANEVWLGKHPDGDKATPGWDNVEILKRFLNKKYRERQWYDESAAARKTEPVRSRADSASSLGSPSGLESPSAPAARKRVGSRDGVNRGANVLMGQDSHRSFLAATHARAAAQQHAAGMSPSQQDVVNVDEENEDDSDGDSFSEVADPKERENQRRDQVRKDLLAFYKIHNPEKLDSLELFVEWVMYHGMSAFNKKLREKYGTDIPNNKKNDLKTRKDKRSAKERHATKAPLRKEMLDQAAQLAALEEAAQAMALQDLASRKRAGSTNPFDDGTPSLVENPFPSFHVETKTSNPFDDLMFL